MSESSSGVNTSSNSFSKSYSSHCSDLSETNTPLPILSSKRRTLPQSCDSGISSPLPCDAFKYLTWHKLKEHDVQGTQIRSPRVREGPPDEELVIRGEAHLSLESAQTSDKEIWRRRLQENWENCVNINLSYQGLGDPYQQNNLHRILRRLIRVERLWLVDNSLKDLSAIRLPRCKELNLSKNHFTTFKQLPKLPAIQHLSLAENNIEALCGLADLKHSPLESLVLKSNPCEFLDDYRQRVFSILPNLKTLDGIPKLSEDWSVIEESHFFSSKCTIL
ncbi:protein tilB homolog [Rana temporaria]|uniref:protein tilB homolog n=1 Tax=Rana temporaria TaxID=8407 RepID=UPI001AACEA19|nr:protein tilB homolog [Rana temporaria]